MAEQEKSCGSCEKESCSAKDQRPDESLEQFLERTELRRRMCRIGRKIIVLSGKGGVGKSTVAVNLAVGLSLQGKAVGLLDADIHGPSVPKLFALEKRRCETQEGTLIPPVVGDLKLMSLGFLLGGGDDAVIWRGPMKMSAIKQLLKDTEWGDLDFLVVDCPPGTGDEPLSVVQLIEDVTGAVIVTTPQEVAILDVRRAITFCRKLNVPVLGVIENMSGFTCPKCGTVVDIFKSGGGEKMASEMGVPFLGRIPLDPQVAEAGDSGEPFVHLNSKTEAAKAFARVVGTILNRTQTQQPRWTPARNRTTIKEE